MVGDVIFGTGVGQMGLAKVIGQVQRPCFVAFKHGAGHRLLLVSAARHAATERNEMWSKFVPLNTIALELVPPNLERGVQYPVDEARKVLALATETGIEGRIRHVMIPGMIDEDDDRPIEVKPRVDVLELNLALDRLPKR